MTRSRAGSLAMPVRPSVGALLATPPAATRSAVLPTANCRRTLKSVLRRRGCDLPSAPRSPRPRRHPAPLTTTAACPASRRGPGAAAAAGRRGLARAGGERSLFADYFAGREVAQAGVSTSGAVPPARRASGGGVSAASPPPPPSWPCGVQLLASEMREGDGGRLHTVYRVRARVGPFERTTYRRFSAFLELHPLAARPRCLRRRRPRSPLRNERLQLQPHKHTEGRTAAPKYVDELCAVPEASAELAAFFWPEAGDGSVVAPDGRRGRCSRLDFFTFIHTSPFTAASSSRLTRATRVSGGHWAPAAANLPPATIAMPNTRRRHRRPRSRPRRLRCRTQPADAASRRTSTAASARQLVDGGRGHCRARREQRERQICRALDTACGVVRSSGSDMPLLACPSFGIKKNLSCESAL